MAELQEVFNRMQENKQQQKQIKRAYREALENSQSYREICEELKVLKAKKNAIEGQIQQDFAKEFDQLEAFQADLGSDNLVLSDLAINKLVKGEELNIVDQYENKYEPVFNVKFKKVI